jgi:hypothetical protein
VVLAASAAAISSASPMRALTCSAPSCMRS